MYEEVHKLLTKGVIVESHSELSAHIVMARNPGGKFRLCSDFRKLKFISKNIYPQNRSQCCV